MKPVSIHPFSALAGAGLLGLVLLAAGAVQAPIRVRPFPQGLVRIAGIPDPRQMVVIKEGTPFSVPQGNLLVVTGLGPTEHLGSSTWTTLLVDGKVEAATTNYLDAASSGSIRPLPPGMTVASGSVVTADDNVAGMRGRAWGYLVDA